jgi:hypothetical protein
MGKHKYGQKDKLPPDLGRFGDDPIHDKDLPPESKHRPEDDKGDANRKDKD